MEKSKATPTPRPPAPIKREGNSSESAKATSADATLESPAKATSAGATLESPARNKRENLGFLPFHTNAFDRVFIGFVILIGIHLLWLRFMEPNLPIEAATVISLVIGYIVVRRG